MIYILTQKENTECTECVGQDVEIIAVRSSLKKGLEAIKRFENEESHWRRFELVGYDVDTDSIISKTIATLDRRVDMEKSGLTWTLWIADEYKDRWNDGK